MWAAVTAEWRQCGGAGEWWYYSQATGGYPQTTWNHTEERWGHPEKGRDHLQATGGQQDTAWNYSKERRQNKGTGSPAWAIHK